MKWFDTLRRRREARVAQERPLSPAEKDRYRKSWATAAQILGIAVAKITGKQEARTIAEKTGERYGEQVAREMDRDIAERRGEKPSPK